MSYNFQSTKQTRRLRCHWRRQRRHQRLGQSSCILGIRNPFCQPNRRTSCTLVALRKAKAAGHFRITSQRSRRHTSELVTRGRSSTNSKQGLVHDQSRGSKAPLTQAAPLVVEDVIALHSSLVTTVQTPVDTFSNMRIDHVHRRVTFELPVIKTAPSAVGSPCHSAEVASDCVFHAAAHLHDVVLTAFGIMEGDSLVTKAAVIATIEHVAEILKEPLLNPAGVRSFSGRSLRVSGAQWLGT